MPKHHQLNRAGPCCLVPGGQGPCLLYILERTLVHSDVMSEMCQKRSLRLWSLDQFVGEGEQLVGNVEAKGLGGPDVNNQFELRRL